MLLQVIILILSIVALYYGAEFALEAAEKVGQFLGLSPLVIGLLIVGFGTSLPEFFVSQLACFRGESNIALGNIVGSNIANMFLILGVAGVVETLYIQREEIKKQFFVHLAITSILCFGLYTESMSKPILGALCLSFVFFLWMTFSEMKKQRTLRSVEELSEEGAAKLAPMDVIKLIVGFFLLYLGGEMLVSSGTKIGVMAGISTYVISAIFVAFGTSFPELVTTILACVKKKDTDLITGNIIGSNIFNMAFVLGSLIPYKISVDRPFKVEIAVLMAAALFFILLTFMKKNFARKSGALFLMGYAYMVWYWVS